MVQALKGANIEERVRYLSSLRERAPEGVGSVFSEKLDISWIYHDSVLEGVVYTMDELQSAILNEVVSDSSLIPVYDEIRNHKAGIQLIRELSAKSRLKISLDVIKNIYITLSPEEMEGRGAPKYRKEMPLHRLYFHEIAKPPKISYQMRQFVDWLNSADTKRSVHPVRLAAQAHFQLLQIFPFPKNSGKVARLIMNLILLHNDYPPAIIHATERQRYYESLKKSQDLSARVVQSALTSSTESGIQYFEHALGIEPEE